MEHALHGTHRQSLHRCAHVADLHAILECIKAVKRLAEGENAREIEDDELGLASNVDSFASSADPAELLHQSRGMVGYQGRSRRECLLGECRRKSAPEARMLGVGAGHDAPGAVGPLSEPSRRLGEGGAARGSVDGAPGRRRREGDLVRGDANDGAIAEVQGFELVRVPAAPYGLGEEEWNTGPEFRSRNSGERM